MLSLFAIILLATVWIAIPMLPAILFQRVCPNMVIITGKVPGTDLTLSAAGAVAVYFVVLFLLMYELVGTATKGIATLGRPYWEVTGRAHFGTKVVEPDDRMLRNMVLQADPSNLSHNGSQLIMKIPEEITLSFPPTLTFPTINIVFAGYPEWRGHVDLSETKIPWWKFWGHSANEMRIDPLFKQIEVSKITVNKVPPRGTYDSKEGVDRPDPALE
jgi:hypothetical protein